LALKRIRGAAAPCLLIFPEFTLRSTVVFPAVRE
jgi:hypothetical protein